MSQIMEPLPGELPLNGPIVLVESENDPHDIGEPRVVEEDGITYVTVPPRTAWSGFYEADIWRRLEQAAAAGRPASLTLWSPYRMADGSLGWSCRWEQAILGFGRRTRYERFFGEGLTRKTALRALAIQLVDLPE